MSQNSQFQVNLLNPAMQPELDNSQEKVEQLDLENSVRSEEQQDSIAADQSDTEQTKPKKKRKFGKKKKSSQRNRKTVSNFKTGTPASKENQKTKKEESPLKDDADQMEYSITAKYHYDNFSFESGKENEDDMAWDNYGNKLIQKFDKNTPTSSKHIATQAQEVKAHKNSTLVYRQTMSSKMHQICDIEERRNLMCDVCSGKSHSNLIFLMKLLKRSKISKMSPNHKSSESRNKDTSIASARATNTSRNELNTSSSRYVNTKAKVQEAKLNKDLQGVSVRESSVKDFKDKSDSKNIKTQKDRIDKIQSLNELKNSINFANFDECLADSMMTRKIMVQADVDKIFNEGANSKINAHESRHQHVSSNTNIQSKILKGRANCVNTPNKNDEVLDEDGLMIRRIKGVMENTNKFNDMNGATFNRIPFECDLGDSIITNTEESYINPVAKKCKKMIVEYSNTVKSKTYYQNSLLKNSFLRDHSIVNSNCNAVCSPENKDLNKVKSSECIKHPNMLTNYSSNQISNK